MPEQKYIRTCSIWRALDVVGDKPTLLILESYWLGTRRFSAFQKQTGLLKTVISDRLNKLIKAGCFEKVLYLEKPKRFEYRATEKFYDLYPAALAMLNWENKWGQTENKVKVSLTHKSCGQDTLPRAVCKSCRMEINPRDVSWAEGPGVGLMPAVYQRRRHKARSVKDSFTPLFDEIADIMGDRWAALIIRSVFTNRNSFHDICDDTAIATNILSERLDWLCQAQVLQKKHTSYKLTEKGCNIYPILLELMQWGDKWYASTDGPPLILTHAVCGKPLISEMACPACGQGVSVDDINFEFTTFDNKTLA